MIGSEAEVQSMKVNTEHTALFFYLVPDETLELTAYF